MYGFGERIRTLRTRRGISQAALADALNVSRSSIAMWERDLREPSLDAISRLAAALHVSPGELIAPESESPVLSPVQTRRIPLLTAGEPEPPAEEVIHIDAADAECDFALRITNDAMAPTLLPGDIVYICRTHPAGDGNLAVLTLNGKLCLRRLYRTNDLCTLLCDNPRHAPITLPEPEILGVAAAYRRSLR